MIQQLLIKYSNRFVSRRLVLLIDMAIVAISFTGAYIIRHNFIITEDFWANYHHKLPVIMGLSLIAFLLTRPYVGIVRMTSTADAIRIFYAVSLISLLILLYNYLQGLFPGLNLRRISLSTAIIFVFNSLFLLLFTRLFAKLIYVSLIKQTKELINVVIYGAGQAGILTKNALQNDPVHTYNIVGFIDDNPGKIGKSIEGIPVYSQSYLNPAFIYRKKLHEIIISIQNINSERKRNIIDHCLGLNLLVKNIPPVESWINGELSVKQIRNVNIEDLLQREPIRLDNKEVISGINGRVILVTGAAGSIGSEIARQVMYYRPSRLILLDHAETPLYELQLEFRKLFQSSQIAEVVIGDITNAYRMRHVFEKFKPDLVFHAAAYKHVPMMEENPGEAARVNILGTRLLANLSMKAGVHKFILISTDKAVNPTSVMGATKRVAEIYTQGLSNRCSGKTLFITTRFGNVLGSNGSVIPLFYKQIRDGGPLTVTHPDITRYFMTIPEACQLVLEAGTMGKGGEIFVFDMGQPMKLADLARKMIRLSGFEPDKDIKIVYTGLRPGEKLFEELLSNLEDTLPTYHPKIMIGKVNGINYKAVASQFTELEKAISSGDNMAIVTILKQMVPEYHSKNSVFEQLDQPSLQTITC